MPGFQALAVYRFGRWVQQRRTTATGLSGWLYRLLATAHRVLYMLVRNVYGIELPIQATIGRRLRLSHQHGIVLIQGSSVGDDCHIHQNVTLGRRAQGSPPPVPRLGNRVEVAPGAVILGDITVGDGARIGPNAVVIHDVPPAATVVAAAARVIEQNQVEHQSTDSPSHNA